MANVMAVDVLATQGAMPSEEMVLVAWIPTSKEYFFACLEKSSTQWNDLSAQ